MARKYKSREDTLRLLASIPAAIKAQVRAEIEKQAAAVVAAQKALVPRVSGGLAGTIRYAMGDVSLASSANLAGGGVGRAAGSRAGGSAGGVIKGDPDLTATIVAGDRKNWYPRFVEFGTKPHVIKPHSSQSSLYLKGRKGRRGAWLAPGRAVNHPGAKPHPFFYGPYRARKTAIKRAVSRATGRAVKAAVQ